MRFCDVNNEKSNLPAVLLVEFIEGRDLPPKRRSGVAAEYQDHRLTLIQDGELNSFTFVQLEQREVRRRIANVKGSGASVKPGGFKWKDQEGNGTGHPGHNPPKGFGRLMHRPPDVSPETNVTDHQAHNEPEQEP
jgi:hypothetical protein